MSTQAFTITYGGIVRSLHSRFGVFPHELHNTKDLPQKYDDLKWDALWDTGAENTVITKKIVNALSLSPVSQCIMYTPQGSCDANVYYVDIMLPNGVIVPKLRVIEGSPSGCDALVGMDIIQRGDIAVSNFEGKTVFSFRIPSMTDIDFVKEAKTPTIKTGPQPGRNSTCTCGSGKKYKNCCGRV